jgi:hypothetical protein
MQREIIRVEPIDSNFEKWGAPVSTCTRAGNMVFVSGMPPFDPETGEILVHAPFERQVELILEQMKKALEAAGSDLGAGRDRRCRRGQPSGGLFDGAGHAGAGRIQARHDGPGFGDRWVSRQRDLSTRAGAGRK